MTFKRASVAADVPPRDLMARLPLVFIALVALVLAGCGGTTHDASTGGAELAPADTAAFITFDTDLDSSQWQTVEELADRFPDKEKAVDFVKKGLREDDVDWERDLKPALGPEFTMLWLDFENGGQNFVGLIQPDDEEAFKRLVEKQKEEDTVYEKFRDWYVVADKRETIARFRRESEASGSLAESDRFSDAIDSYPEDSLFRGYVNGDAVMKFVRSFPDPEARKMIDKLGTLDWIAAGLHASSDGIRFDTTVHGTAGSALKDAVPTRAYTPALQHEVPRDALLFASFHGSKGMFTGLESNPLFNDTPELKQYTDVIRRVESLLQGENAFYVRPGKGKLPEVTFVAEPARGTNGMTTLDRILLRYRKQLELVGQPRPTRVAGTPARVLDFIFFKLYYANVGKRLVVTDLPAGITTLKGDPPSLAQSDEYKDALDSAGMPAKTQGFLYVDVRGGVSYAERLAEAPIPGEIKRNLGPLRSAVEYALTRPSEIQVTFFLRIK
jgi:hypothetical protein